MDSIPAHLSTVALDRMAWAAERASDPCLGAVRQYMRALVYFREGEYTIGQRLVTSGHGIVSQAEVTRESLAVAGQLHLGASVISARAEDEAAVDQHITEAGGIAERIGDASDVHWLSFGPANVAMHRMSAAIEMGQYDDAPKQARKIRLPSAIAASRRAHFLIDRARTEVETGHTDKALEHLLKAPIRVLVHLSRRTPDTLSHMAAWIGL